MTGSYIRNLLVSGCGVSMDLRNQYDALDPDDPGYVSLSEVDPGSSPDQEMHPVQVHPHDAMDIDCSFDHFVRCFDYCSLPGDSQAAGPFDNRSDFTLGDPGVDHEGNNRCEYATSGEVGEPHWPQLFLYLIQHCEQVRQLGISTPSLCWLITVTSLLPRRNRSPLRIGRQLRPGGPVDLPYMGLPVNCVTSDMCPSTRQLDKNMSILPGQALFCVGCLCLPVPRGTLCVARQ